MPEFAKYGVNDIARTMCPKHQEFHPANELCWLCAPEASTVANEDKHYGWYSAQMYHRHGAGGGVIWTRPNGSHVLLTSVTQNNKSSGYHPSVTDALFRGEVIDWVRKG